MSHGQRKKISLIFLCSLTHKLSFSKVTILFLFFFTMRHPPFFLIVRHLHLPHIHNILLYIMHLPPPDTHSIIRNRNFIQCKPTISISLELGLFNACSPNWAGLLVQPCTPTITCNVGESGTSINMVGLYVGNKLRKFNFSSFPNLVSLNLSTTGHWGSIQLHIGTLSKLTHLDPSHNYLIGVTCLFHLQTSPN